MTIEVESQNFVYRVLSHCGRPTDCSRRRLGDDRYTPVEWSELPFLVQSRIEAQINENLDGVPSELWKR